MHSRHVSFSAALAATLFLSACGPGTARDEPPPGQVDPLVQIQGASCVTLLAGQTLVAGTVCSTVEGDDVRVTYTTSNGWRLTEAHLWAGLRLSDLPQTNSGNPRVGNFPFHSGALAGAASFSFLVPLSTFGLSGSQTACSPVTGYVVSHAVVRRALADGTLQTETAYGEGTRLVQRGNWATWFSVVMNCVDDTSVATCETTYASGGAAATCFIGSGLVTTNRWGWTNGPLGPGRHSFDLSAGAAQCDLARGTPVGTLLVVYDGATATVTYSMRPGFLLDETHLYVGNEPLPRKNGEYTVAPGQYGHLHSLAGASSDSFTVTGLSGSVYVVAHAATCSTVWPE